MEQPVHNLRSHLDAGNGSAAAPRRVGGLVAVVLVHIAIVALLIVGMKSGEIAKKLEDIKVAVEKDKTPPKAPPPPPPDLVKPPPPFVPPPEFVIQNDAPATNAITTTSVKPPVAAPPAPPAPPPTKLEPIRSTFTLPPYPEASQRLGEQGTTLLKITISTEGRVTDAEVSKSSGSTRLDQAAVDWVKSHYRYKPPTTNGQPSEAATLLAIKWDLKNAQ